MSEEGRGREELAAESSSCLPSHPPLTVLPSFSARPGARGAKEKAVQRERQRGSWATLARLAQDSGIPGPLELCAHTHTHTHILTNTHAGVPVVIQISAGLWEREDKTERVGEEWGRKELFLWTIGAGWHLPWEECLWGTEDWNQDQAEEPAADGGEGFILYLF